MTSGQVPKQNSKSSGVYYKSCLGYTPYDGVTETRIVTVNVSITVLFTLVNSGGLLFAVTCFVFTSVCRKNK